MNLDVDVDLDVDVEVEVPLWKDMNSKLNSSVTLRKRDHINGS